MESILRWAVENTPEDAPQAPPTAERMKELDPAIIDMILGKSDAVVMKEKLAIAQDASREEDERIEALDDFEMASPEQIDNANNLENLKMWDPLIELMHSSPAGIARQVIWILGTAVQNNSTAQKDFLKRDPLPYLLSLLSSNETSGSTRSKVLYCLSGTLKHNVGAVRRLDELGGWEVLKHSLQDPEISVRRKTVFLINTLLLQDTKTQSTAAALHSSDGPQMHRPEPVEETSTEGLVQRVVTEHGLIRALVKPPPYGPNGDSDAASDDEYREKVLQVLDTFSQNGGALDEEAKAFRQAHGA